MDIQKYRKKCGFTQRQLANLLSVDTSTVTKWETGEAMPRTDKLPEIAKILHCSIEDLFKEV
ncbi:MAG: helix-turn-helix domain-containing protein [Clostridiales bacterium]|nr:helix-turn-helix domain-containing protein [Clostridiales bacterium]